MSTKNLILLLSLSTVILLFIIEQILIFDYLYKTIAKIVIFFITIFFFHYITKRKTTYFSIYKMDFRKTSEV